jgi:hypothetical protein
VGGKLIAARCDLPTCAHRDPLDCSDQFGEPTDLSTTIFDNVSLDEFSHAVAKHTAKCILIKRERALRALWRRRSSRRVSRREKRNGAH